MNNFNVGVSEYNYNQDINDETTNMIGGSGDISNGESVLTDKANDSK